MTLNSEFQPQVPEGAERGQRKKSWGLEMPAQSPGCLLDLEGQQDSSPAETGGTEEAGASIPDLENTGCPVRACGGLEAAAHPRWSWSLCDPDLSAWAAQAPLGWVPASSESSSLSPGAVRRCISAQWQLKDSISWPLGFASPSLMTFQH